MKIVFLIDHKGVYRYFSSLIYECIERNAEIELWHYNFSSKQIKIEDSPFFLEHISSNITFKIILNDNEVIEHIINSKNADYFVSLYPVTFELNDSLKKIISGKWCIIQHGVDSFAMLWHWQYFDFEGKLFQNYERLFFPYTNNFLEIGLDWMKKYSDENGKHNYKFFTENKTTIFPIGSPMFKGNYNSLNLESIREKYKIPFQKKILIYLPFPFYPSRAKYSKNGSYAWEAAFSGIHISNKNLSKGSLFLIKSIIKKLIFFWKILINREARTWFINKWNEPSVIKELRKFCDINDLFLVVKPRKKFPFSEEVYKASDLIIDDDELQFYPSMLQELFAISEIAMGYSTTAVFESIQNEVPFINIESPDALFNHEEARIELHNYSDYGKYNFKGVVHSIDVPSLINNFHSSNIEEYALNLDARNLYMEKFLGKDKPTAAMNFYKILEKNT